MNRQNIAHRFLTVSTFLSVLAAMGCESFSPVSPSQDNTPSVENPVFVHVLSTSEDSYDRDLEQTPSTSVSMVVSAETGGTVTNGYFSLYFPPGALEEDTEITISMPRYPEAVVELGPHGIEFNKSVIMSLPLTMIDADASSYSALWYNESTGIWENIGGRLENNSVISELEHFSEYGFADIG